MNLDDIQSILQVAGSVEIDELDVDIQVEDWSIKGTVRGLRIHVAENTRGSAADISANAIGKSKNAGSSLVRRNDR